MEGVVWPDRTSSAWAVLQSVAAKLLIIGINAATGIITARALQPAGRGELAAMILWPVFLASALTLGIPSALTFQLRRSPERRSELTGAALLLAMATSWLAIAVGTIFLHAWIPQYSPSVILAARWFLLSAPLTSLLLVGRAAFESRAEFSTSNKLLVWSPALTLVWLSVLLANRSVTPYHAAMAYVPVGLVPVSWMLYRMWRTFRPSLAGFLRSSRTLFTYGIRSYGIDLCGTMALYVDQALVVRVLSPGLMGTYVVALSLSRMLNVFHNSVIMVLFPRAINLPPHRVREISSRAARLSTLLTAVAGCGIISVGPQVLGLLYGAEYRGATAVLRILVVEVVLSGMTLVLAQTFMALGRPGVITALQLTGLLLVVPLMFVLVPRFGLVGAGLSLLLSTTVRLIVLLASFPIVLKIPMPEIVPSRDDMTFILGLLVRGVSRRPRRLAFEGAE
jgi:O-antigen/teichoic acid export membrane protein